MEGVCDDRESCRWEQEGDFSLYTNFKKYIVFFFSLVMKMGHRVMCIVSKWSTCEVHLQFEKWNMGENSRLQKQKDEGEGCSSVDGSFLAYSRP